jgi:hypothetical protein
MTVTLVAPPVPATPQPATPQPAAQARSRIVAWAWPLSVLALVAVVQGWNITGYPAIGDDEGTYLAQAWAVLHGHGLAHYTYWYDHPPLGWMQLATVFWLPDELMPGTLAVAAARLVMLVASLVSASLLYVLARRLRYARWAAALAVALFTLTPLAIAMQRQVYLDNIAIPWMLGAFVLAGSPRRHLWHHVAAGACAAVSVLSKETMLLVVPGLIVMLWQASHVSTRTYSLTGFASAFGLTGVSYPLYAALNRELFPGEGHVSLVGALLFQMHDRAGSGSMLSAGSGARALLDSWLYQDPTIVFAGAAAVIAALAVRRLRPVAIAGTVLVAIALRPGGYLPAMYVLQALPFFALALAGLADSGVGLALTRLTVPRVRTAVGAALAVALTATLLPAWYDGQRRALTTPANDRNAAAVAWITAQVPDPAHRRIVVDDALWLDMVRAGFVPGTGAIWFYKLDLDPEVKATLPHGWRDIDYIVSSPILRQDQNDLPTVDDLMAHSEVAAAFGDGDDRVEIRRVTGATR